MAGQFYLPDDADTRILREIIARERKRKSTGLQRTDPETMFNEEIDNPPTGVYIAVPGIGFEDVPAMEDDASFGIGEVKSGLCDILFIEEETGLIKQAGFQERVFNISRSTLPLEPFHIILDGFGNWSAVQGGGSTGIFAVITAKELVETDFNVRGKYRCEEVEWFENGSWQKKAGGRIFTNCYESSMNSNANLQITKLNVVHLFRPSMVTPSSSSSAASASAASEIGASSSSSSSANVIDDLYVFDKALGGIANPVHI